MRCSSASASVPDENVEKLRQLADDFVFQLVALGHLDLQVFSGICLFGSKQIVLEWLAMAMKTRLARVAGGNLPIEVMTVKGMPSQKIYCIDVDYFLCR